MELLKNIRATPKDIAALKTISERNGLFNKAWLHHITAYSLIRKELVEQQDEGFITLTEKGKSLIQ